MLAIILAGGVTGLNLMLLSAMAVLLDLLFISIYVKIFT